MKIVVESIQLNSPSQRVIFIRGWREAELDAAPYSISSSICPPSHRGVKVLIDVTAPRLHDKTATGKKVDYLL